MLPTKEGFQVPGSLLRSCSTLVSDHHSQAALSPCRVEQGEERSTIDAEIVGLAEVVFPTVVRHSIRIGETMHLRQHDRCIPLTH
jgi:hypothetical protein